MIVIQCVDNRNGTSFNSRRQSRDKLLRRRILSQLEGRPLWMNAASYRQFQEDNLPEGSVRVAEDFLAQAGSGEICFVEGLPLTPWRERLEAVVLYRWNRDYPADTYLDLDLGDWSLVSRFEFSGTSHPAITEEVYRP